MNRFHTLREKHCAPFLPELLQAPKQHRLASPSFSSLDLLKRDELREHLITFPATSARTSNSD
jgi:hypothetical protein